MTRRHIRGELAYLHDHQGHTGHEWFSVTVEPNGERVVRARCEMEADQVLRDVVWSMDAAWRPRDAYVHLSVGGAFKGVAWCRFDGNVAECEGFNAAAGRIRQRLVTDDPIAIFGAHPVAGDAMKPAPFDRGKADRTQSFQSISTSPLPNGASGPILAARRNVFELIGEEQVTVPAGVFACTHFRWHFTEFPPIEIWHHGPDLIPVRVRWDLLQSNYDLVALDVS